jgi:hypothetical protein
MQYAATDLYDGFKGNKPPLDMPDILYIIMGVGILLKFVLWLYCLQLNKRLNSDTVGEYRCVCAYRVVLWWHVAVNCDGYYLPAYKPRRCCASFPILCCRLYTGAYNNLLMCSGAGGGPLQRRHLERRRHGDRCDRLPHALLVVRPHR